MSDTNEKYDMTVNQHPIAGDIEIGFNKNPESFAGINLKDKIKEIGAEWNMKRRVWKFNRDLVDWLDDSDMKVYIKQAVKAISFTINNQTMSRTQFIEMAKAFKSSDLDGDIDSLPAASPSTTAEAVAPATPPSASASSSGSQKRARHSVA